MPISNAVNLAESVRAALAGGGSDAGSLAWGALDANEPNNPWASF